MKERFLLLPHNLSHRSIQILLRQADQLVQVRVPLSHVVLEPRTEADPMSRVANTLHELAALERVCTRLDE